MREDFEEAVAVLVAMIPSGRVLAYGDIAELLGCGGPRQVGKVMSNSDGGLPWWRVVRASGLPPVCHGQSALLHYGEEGTPMRTATSGTGRLKMSEARWQPTEGEWERIDDLRERLAMATTAGGSSRMSDRNDCLEA